MQAIFSYWYQIPGAWGSQSLIKTTYIQIQSKSRDGTLKFGFFLLQNKPNNPKTNVKNRRTLVPHGHSEKTSALRADILNPTCIYRMDSKSNKRA
jgi:hypothetical protein